MLPPGSLLVVALVLGACSGPATTGAGVTPTTGAEVTTTSGPGVTTTSGAGAAGGGARPSGVPGYQVVRDIRLPGNTSRWDYQTDDPASHRLYIAHLGASQIVAFDTAQQAVAGVITGIANVHGLALATDLGRLFASATGDNRLVAIDPTRMAILDRQDLDGCQGAHGVQTDAAPRRRVFVACENNDSMVVFDLTAKRVSQRFEVGKGPDVLALDAVAHRLYVAAESGELAVFDTTGDSVLKVGQGNAGPDARSVTVDPMSHLVYLPLTDVGGHPMLRELQQQ
jgi:DNA-binding beta-propeller fold protein YncE